jgi:hypothetical protein
MKLMRLLIAALLAVTLIASLGAITAPQFSMFSAPSFSIYHTGFNQISPSQVGKTSILFAPSQSQMLSGLSTDKHFKPKLMTNNWGSSMKTSGVNQMMAMMMNGIGKKSSIK